MQVAHVTLCSTGQEIVHVMLVDPGPQSCGCGAEMDANDSTAENLWWKCSDFAILGVWRTKYAEGGIVILCMIQSRRVEHLRGDGWVRVVRGSELRTL